MKRSLLALGAMTAFGMPVPALAQEVDSARFGWFSGDWRLTVGVSGAYVPEFEGADDNEFRVSPLISFGRAGPEARFSSRNDNISIALFDEGSFRAGVAGRIVFPRDSDDSDALRGLDDIDWGGEAGAFAEVYPLDWLRLRGEVRQGFSAHTGIVADFSADAFYDVTETIRISGGPRLSLASADYFDAYYGVNTTESLASGLGVYDPGGGIRAAGVGGQVNWKVTDRITTSLFGEYSRLMGPAADSTLVRARGSENQYTIGVSTTYRFDFTIP